MAQTPIKRRRSKPCRFCRKWFTPDPRVGERQKACSEPACKADRKRGAQADWARRNPDYWIERRLTQQAERLASELTPPPARAPPPYMCQVPVAFVQDKMGTEATVILVYLLRLQHRAMQVEWRAQMGEMMAKSGQHRRSSAQDAMEPEGQPP